MVKDWWKSRTLHTAILAEIAILIEVVQRWAAGQITWFEVFALALPVIFGLWRLVTASAIAGTPKAEEVATLKGRY